MSMDQNLLFVGRFVQLLAVLFAVNLAGTAGPPKLIKLGELPLPQTPDGKILADLKTKNIKLAEILPTFRRNECLARLQRGA